MSHYVCVCYVTNHPRIERVNTVTILFAHDSVLLLLLLLVLPRLAHMTASDGSAGLVSPRWSHSGAWGSVLAISWAAFHRGLRAAGGRPLEKLYALTSAF